MENRRKKSLTVLLGLTLLVFVSGFCADSFVLIQAAQAAEGAAMSQENMGHANHPGKESNFFGHDKTGNRMLPCCNEKKEDVTVTEAAKLTDKTLIASLGFLETNTSTFEAKKDRIPTDYLTAPPGGGLVSSVIKKE